MLTVAFDFDVFDLIGLSAIATAIFFRRRDLTAARLVGAFMLLICDIFSHGPPQWMFTNKHCTLGARTAQTTPSVLPCGGCDSCFPAEWEFELTCDLRPELAQYIKAHVLN